VLRMLPLRNRTRCTRTRTHLALSRFLLHASLVFLTCSCVLSCAVVTQCFTRTCRCANTS
jgi:hypothetical protein